MTIFDSIRWPVPDALKEGDLEGIHADLYIYWYFHVMKPEDGSNSRENLKRLREIIKTYNTDDCEVAKWKLSEELKKEL